jgi:hypothetical protein
MPIEIKKTYFVSPVEEFQIVGRESYGPNWKPDCADDPDSAHRHLVLGNLRAALQSGQVSAFWHDFDYERELTPIDAAGEFFRINLAGNCIHLSFSAGKPIQCGIHADQLALFIRSEGARSTKLTIGAENACFQWLLSKMSGDEGISKSDTLWRIAKQEFPALSRAAFLRARKRAIEDAGRPELRRAGRPRTKSNRSPI